MFIGKPLENSKNRDNKNRIQLLKIQTLKVENYVVVTEIEFQR